MSRLRIPVLDEDVRALVRRAAAIDAAPASARDRVSARVDAIVGSPFGEGEGHAGAPGPATLPLGGARPPVAERAVAVAAGFVLGAAVGALVTARVLRTPAPVVVAPIASVERDVPPVTAVAPPAPPAATNTPPISEPLAAGNARALEPATSVARERPVPPAPASSHAPSPRVDAPDWAADERTLLDVARGAIEREDGAAALAATAEHERKYPRGVLVQEREAMAVRALALLGRMTEARARVEAFRERFPDSMLLPALESSVGTAP